MSTLKNSKVEIVLDKPRHLLFSLNALDEIQDKFGDLQSLPEQMQGKGALKVVRSILTILLNEGDFDEGEVLTERQVGNIIHAGNLKDAQAAILKAMNIGITGGKAGEGDQDEKNPKGGEG